MQGVQLVWESYKLDPYVQRLAESVFLFQEKVGSYKTWSCLWLCLFRKLGCCLVDFELHIIYTSEFHKCIMYFYRF